MFARAERREMVTALVVKRSGDGAASSGVGRQKGGGASVEAKRERLWKAEGKACICVPLSQFH